jgi:hypothetical protein
MLKSQINCQLWKAEMMMQIFIEFGESTRVGTLIMATLL